MPRIEFEADTEDELVKLAWRWVMGPRHEPEVAGILEYDKRHGQLWYSLWVHDWAIWLSANAGLILIWAAGILTVVTGYDYLVKAMPFLRDRKR